MWLLDRIPFYSIGLWPLRALWFALPLIAGLGFADTLAAAEGAVSITAEAGLWAGWFVGLVALLAPSTVSLTVVRLLAPSALAASIWASIWAGVFTAAAAGAIAATLVVLLLVMHPLTGDPMVNGSSYGPERRMALRPPAALLLGPIQLAWFLMFFGLAGGAILVAGGNYLIGLPMLAVGLLVLWRGGLSLHQLARRWIVFVPAGFVIHDYWSLAESFLVRRSELTALGPAPLDKGEILDLTGGAQGLALLVELKDKTPLALRARKTVQTFPTSRIMFTPTLPGRLLHEARIRGIKIG